MQNKLRRALLGSCAISLAQFALGYAAQARDFIPTPAPEPTEIEAPWAQRIQDFINVGPFKFNADASVAEVYSDNIYSTRNDKKGDAITVFKPGMSAVVDVGQHELNFWANAELGRYNRFKSEDYNDYTIGTDGRYRFNASTSLLGGAEYDWTHEGRESPDAVNGTEPTKYQQGTYWLGLVHRSADFVARLGATVNDYSFDNVSNGVGGTINNKDRDRKQVEFGTRVGYRWTPNWEPFFQGYLDRRNYDSSVDDNGFNRDSKGYRIATGLRGNAGPSLQGEVYVGVIHQDYTDPALKDVDAPDLGASLDWKAAPATTVSVFLDRSLEETTLPGASSYLASTFGARADHKMRDDLYANAHFYITKSDYQGVSRTDREIDSGLSLKYFFAPNLFVSPSYSLIQRTSNWIDGDFTENRVMISFGAQLAPAYKGDPSTAAPFNSDWGLSGFYTGVQMGVGTLATALNGPRGPGTNTSDFGNEGFQGGAFLGYGLTLNRIYLGFEFDGEGGDQTWQHDGTGGTRVYSVRKRGSYEAAARLGYKLDNQALVYGRAGIVTSRFETSYTQGATTTVKDEQQRGMRYGAGTDFPITGNFFGRMEYTFTSYADYDMPTSTGADNFANSESLMRFGIGFRFNRGPEKVKTPTVDYNGFYVGLQGGHGSLTTDNAGLRTSPQTLSVSRSGFGTGGGIFGGYGHAFGPVYLGGELEADLSNTDWKIKRDPNGRIYSVRKDYSYGGSLRAGYIVESNTLIYARAGLVRTRFGTDYATSGSSATSQEDKTGIRVGGGVEMPVRKNVQMRLDYTWTDYGSYNLKYSNSPTGTDSFKNAESLFRVGFAYKF